MEEEENFVTIILAASVVLISMDGNRGPVKGHSTLNLLNKSHSAGKEDGAKHLCNAEHITNPLEGTQAIVTDPIGHRNHDDVDGHTVSPGSIIHSSIDHAPLCKDSEGNHKAALYSAISFVLT